MLGVKSYCCCIVLALQMLMSSPLQAETSAQDWAGREVSSVDDLEVALAAKPRDFDTLMALGMAWLNLKEYVKAAEILEAAVSVSPDSSPAHLFLGQAYNEQLIRFPIRPQKQNAPSEDAQIVKQMTEEQRATLTARADREFETALRLGPRDPYAWTLWGQALLKRGQNNPLLMPTLNPDLILDKFRTALKIDKDYRPASGLLAKLLYTYGGLYLHYARYPNGPPRPPWAPEDLRGTAEKYADEAATIYWSYVRKLPQEQVRSIVSLYETLLELLLFLERHDEALSLCREHIDPRDDPDQLRHVIKRRWDSLLETVKKREGEHAGYRASSAAYDKCTMWLEGKQ